MAKTDVKFTPALVGMVAERFKALGEPSRLILLKCVQERPMTVNELVEETGLGQANVSKHLQLLHSLGFVSRRKDGLFTYYTLADKDVFKICEIICNRIGLQTEQQRRRLTG